MVKKLILISAVLLSTTGAWADDVPTTAENRTLDYNGVTYKILSTSGSSVTGTATSSSTAEKTADGVFTYTSTSVTPVTATYAMTVSAYQANTSESTITIQDFTLNPVVTVDDGHNSSTATYAANTTGYNTYIVLAKAVNSEIMSYSETVADSKNETTNIKYKSWSFKGEVDSNGDEVEVADEDLEKYYYTKEGTGKYATYYAIKSIIVNTTGQTQTTYNCSYTVTSIASTLAPASNVTAINFSANVTDVAAGAFVGASMLEYVNKNSADTANFVWDAFYQTLFKKENGNRTKVVVAAYTAPGKTLPSTVNEIYDYAYNYIPSNNAITITSNYYNITVNTGTQSQYVTFAYPTTMSYVKSGLGYVISNTVKNADLASLPTDGLFYDFTNARIWETLTINNSEAANNILYYFPAGTTVSGNNKNIVIGGTCENLTLTDKMPFYNKTAFTATNAFLNRSMPSNTWATVIVPFTCPLSGTDYIGDYDAYTNGKLCFSKANQLNANTPYMYLNKKSSAATPFKVEGSNVTVPVTNPQTVEPTTGAKFIGTLSETLTLNSGYDYAYTSGGTFIKCAGNSLPPFRAYFYVNTGSESAPGMRFFDEYDNEIEFENVTGINEVSEEENNKVIYNVNGQAVDNMDKPGVYVVNGKKVIVK